MLRFNILLSCFSLFFLFSYHLSAEDIETYDDLVVTAFRTPAQLNAIGSAYSILTADDIENREAILVSDLLRTVPGIEIDRSGPLGTLTTLRMRGGESNHTLVIIDGVVVNDESQGSLFNFADLMTDDIERIEVIRGPQSALWGSEALSGVINITTKKGSGKPMVKMNFEGGSFKSEKFGGSLSGGTKNYNYKLSASKFGTAGTDIKSVSNGDDDGYDNNRLSFSGAYKPIRFLELTSSVNHTSSVTEFDNCTLVFANTDNCNSANDYTYGSFAAVHNSLDYHWQNSLKTTFKLIDHENFANGTQTSAQASKEYHLALQSSVFLKTDTIVDANNAFSLAYEYKSTDTSSINFGTYGITKGVKQNNEVNSFIAEYRLSLFERLHLSASGRYDGQSLYDDYTTYRTTAAFVVPNTGTRLHASYGSGFKNPTLSDLRSVYGTTFLPNPELVPEQSKSWDAGIEQSFFNNRVILDATYFQARLDDEISIDYSQYPTAQTINLGGISKRRGYELSLSANLMDNTDFSASYTYTDSVQDQNGSGTFTREIRRPPHIASFNLNHRFYKDRANINLGMYFNGDDTDTVYPNIVKVDHYTLFNLATSFEISNYVNVYGKIDNLTNQVYQSPVGYFSSGIAVYGGINLTINP